MVLRVYGHKLSIPGYLVVAVCYELGVPFEPIIIDILNGESRTPEHLARNPWGKVPVIDDDGFILCETHAIVRYILDKYSAKGPQLVPSDIEKRALVEQAISFEMSYWDKPICAVMDETFYKEIRGVKPDPVKVEEVTKPLIEYMDIFEKTLAKQRYIAGDELTIADLHFLPRALILDEYIKSNLIQERPNMARWYSEISSRPSWQKAKTAFNV